MNSAGPAERNRPNGDGVSSGLVYREGLDVELLVASAVAIPDLHRQTGRGAPGIFVHAAIGLDVLEDEGAGLGVGGDVPGLAGLSGLTVVDPELGRVAQRVAAACQVDALGAVGVHYDVPVRSVREQIEHLGRSVPGRVLLDGGPVSGRAVGDVERDVAAAGQRSQTVDVARVEDRRVA